MKLFFRQCGIIIQSGQIRSLHFIQMKVRQSKQNSKFSFSSTFNWEDNNIKDLIKQINFYITNQNDTVFPFNHFTHKNLNHKDAPFISQKFVIYLDNLTNVKYLCIDDYTHGSQMTISIAKNHQGPFTQVYKDKFICKGKSLKKQQKQIDIGALPCRAIQISVSKGCKMCSKAISIKGIQSTDIGQKLGDQYYKLLVQNPIKIMYS